MEDLERPRAVPFGLPQIEPEDVAAVVRVLESGWLSTGPECEALEADLAALVGAPHVVALASCTDGLEISLRWLDLPRGARIGVPDWTFVATASAVVATGGVPVLIDADPATLNLSAASAAAAIDAGLDALVVVHFGGVPVDAEVLDLARRHGVPVVEDAAHALGASDARGPVSGRGSVSATYSFYATKNITSGEGGALATHDPAVAAFARSQRLHGLSVDAWQRYRPGARPGYDLESPGLKANLPDILAALARSQLGRFEALQQRRRALVERYRLGLQALGGCRPVPSVADPGSADHLLVVVLPDGVERDDVVASLAAAGVATGIHFRPLHTFAWFERHAALAPGGVPVAEAIGPRALSLPLHTNLADSDVDRVLEVLAEALA
jgi:dTDP-4-amino-4,6-dideoxygalactose transaminase